MIKTALRHWIFEICIERLFDGISKNFRVAQKKKFRIGDKFAYIIQRTPTYILVFNSVVIRNIVQGTFGTELIIECSDFAQEYSTSLHNDRSNRTLTWFRGAQYHYRKIEYKRTYVIVDYISQYYKL